MNYPNYKTLNASERKSFRLAWQHKIKSSPSYAYLYENINMAVRGFKLYFLVVFILIVINSLYHIRFLTIAVLGFFSAQIMFALFHMRIHALFLEYDQWNTASINRVMQTPVVSFYAFYHHHHSDQDNWMPQLSYYLSNNKSGINYILLAHWYGFSFLNIVVKFPFVLLLVITAFFINPYLSLAALLGFELGQFFIPLFHGYGHNVEGEILQTTVVKLSLRYQLIKKCNYGLFFIMNKLYLVATPEQHALHHRNYRTTEFVYRSFSSSGIYFPLVDKLLDKLYVWGFSELPIKAYDKLRKPTLGLVIAFIILPYACAVGIVR